MNRRPIPKVTSTFALALCVGLLSGCPEPDNGGSDRSPFRDSWRTEADQDFIHVSGDGVQIGNLTIGGRESNDNFANRGDIIVNYDGMSNHILVELRRFTFAPNEEATEADFDDLSLWAFTSSLGRPQDQDTEDDCVESGWQTGCEIRVYFDGQSQLRRAGADIRVTLPPDFHQTLNVVTEDNIEDDDYFNRGNVCINNLAGTANVETENGNVWVGLSPDVTPSPKCSEENLLACENFEIDGMPAPWAPACPCVEFGQVRVNNRPDTASDITLQMPNDLWAAVTAENKGDGQQASGEHCEANINVANAVPSETGNDFPWQARSDVNFPGEPALRGAGFNIQLFSNGCGPVAGTEDPSDFVGVGNGEDQESEERGNIEVCNDCITQTCDELIP